MSSAEPMSGALGAEVAGRPLRVLLVEDDDADALIVEELLEEIAAPVELHHVRTLAEALQAPPGLDCALLDLNLPDATGTQGLRALREANDRLAILVLTGLDDERRGIEALAAGAQDYLIKGHVDGALLSRSIRYAVERRRAVEAQRQLALARMRASENRRLERGLLPTPLLVDPTLRVASHYRAGRRRALLGGDFYDVVEAVDGTVHAVIGDVCGHGPDEAAVGVALRIAWRALVLSGSPPAQLLPTLEQVLQAERHDPTVFTTLALLELAPDRRSVELTAAGHPSPLLLDGTAIAPLTDRPSGPPIGIVDGARWQPRTHPLPAGPWSLLLYTDGVVEGRCGDGAARLGERGLIEIVERARVTHAGDPAAVVRRVVEAAEELNAGPLLDDVALVLMSRSA